MPISAQPSARPPAASRRRPFGQRIAMTGGGLALIIVAPVIGILPGPGGIFVFALGVALLLRGSTHAKRYYVHGKRRWPKLGALLDRALRRDSARRRANRLRKPSAAHAAQPAAEKVMID